MYSIRFPVEGTQDGVVEHLSIVEEGEGRVRIEGQVSGGHLVVTTSCHVVPFIRTLSIIHSKRLSQTTLTKGTHLCLPHYAKVCVL